jgi:hypothetical protein
MHRNSQKRMVPKIYVQFYCVMINLTNFKHDAQNKVGLDISISKLNLVKFVSKFVKSQLSSC